ncbi:sulfatase-like hydrolase/transferase [Roseimaritima sediminicola]|uniref:sulfatase-like hydrolase/transferase n=1 Tax=Roseimaritima sediminicola TaxID=2662066 RepID=UPI001298281C|nr:sulfatase-like hydrolase/transferase [Roseimaritima sediminicola]
MNHLTPSIRSTIRRCLFFTAIALASLSSSVRAADRRPNVLLIMADDMGFECLGANGGETYQTPRLDRLAANGARYRHCHSQPICTPSRVQIMTGRYNSVNYLRFGVLDPAAHTFGHLFRDAGYQTVIAGKWQLEGGLDGPRHFGFDRYCLWQLTRIVGRYPNPGLEIDGRVVDYREGQYGPDVVTDYLCDYFAQHRDEPFFAYYPMILPHFPFQPTPDSEAWDPSDGVYPKKRWRDEWFVDMVAYTDKMVGKLVDSLEELGLRENTLIIFTGDNGTYRGIPSILDGKPYVGGKGSTRDNGTHVPLIVNWPGRVAPGQESDRLVDFTDMLPTIAEVAGLEVPAEWQCQGVSFAGDFLGSPAQPRHSIYCWYHRDGLRDQASQHVRTARFKLYGDGRFFDTGKDPAEEQPLDPDRLDASTRQLHGRLSAELQTHMRQAAAADPILQARRREFVRTVTRQP